MRPEKAWLPKIQNGGLMRTVSMHILVSNLVSAIQVSIVLLILSKATIILLKSRLIIQCTSGKLFHWRGDFEFVLAHELKSSRTVQAK